MPNWVFNNLSVTGTPEQVSAVKAQLGKSYSVLKDPVPFGSDEPKPFVRETVETKFSFMNIIAPSDEASYYGMYKNLDGTPKDNKESNRASLDLAGAVIFGQIKPEAGNEVNVGGDWYSWNLANWGCKWDASDVYVEEDSATYWAISFDTPWSPPIPAMESLSLLFPDVKFTLRYEEEQGWGGITEFTNGESNEIESWDIPNNHADYSKLEKECVCEWDSDDPDNWFDDCPNKAEALKKVGAEA
jgi:Ferredoxin-like domain in Api92-like protein